MTVVRKNLETVYFARGKWILDYIDFDGKAKRKTLKNQDRKYPKNKTEAKEIAKKFLLNLHVIQQIRSEEEYINRVAEHKNLVQHFTFTLDDVLDLLKRNPRLKNGTRLQTRCFQWLKFREWLKIHYPKIHAPYEITPLMAEEFFNAVYAEGMANSTYNDYVTSFRMIFNIIMPYGGMKSNPFDAIQRLPKNTISHQPIPQEYIEKIIAACDDPNFHVLGTRTLSPISVSELKTLIMLGACTGMRLKDCALLEWSSVDFNSNYIKLIAYKTKQWDRGFLWIPLMNVLRTHLQSIYPPNKSGYVMPLIAHRYLDDARKEKNQKSKTDCGNLSNEVKNLLQYVGLPVSQRLSIAEQKQGITKNIGNRKKSPNLYGFHSLRHYFISLCAENNIPMAYVEAIIGDASEVIKKYYTHINQNDMLRAISNMQSKIFSSQTLENNQTAIAYNVPNLLLG